MKETNLTTIQEAAIDQIDMYGSQLLDYFTKDEAVDILVLIYLTNDKMTGLAQQFIGNMSIVSSPDRVAILFQGHHSFYKTDGLICEYESLADDMLAIGTIVNAAISRWEYQTG